MKWGVTFVTSMSKYAIKSKGDDVVLDGKGTGPPCSIQCSSIENEFLQRLVPWGHTVLDLHCQPLADVD